MWENEGNDRLFMHQNLNKANILIDLLADYNMQLVLPHGIPIQNSAGNLTRPDNVFASAQLTDWKVVSGWRLAVRISVAFGYPISTHIDFPVITNPTQTPRNFRATDWEELKVILDEELLKLEPPRELNSKEELLKALDDLEASIM